MELKNKTVLVAGTGISGIGAVKLLAMQQANIILYDGNKDLTKEKVLAKFDQPIENLQIYIGEMTKELADQCDLMILSPGISIYAPICDIMRECQVPIWGEIELAYKTGKGTIAAITGTNGKTTTTALVGEIFKNYYKSAFVVGNIGIPYTSVVHKMTDESVIAAEISSFQLETIVDFKPHVSAVLNVTPDHLDRHKTMEIYADTKKSISKNQTEEDFFVLNYDDPITKEMGKDSKAKVCYFSRKEQVKQGSFLKDDAFYIADQGEEKAVCAINEINLLGAHNHENVLAAIAIAYFMGVPVENIASTVKAFKAVEHRIEFVATVNGVDYYNDSKGTNTDAAIQGIRAMNRPTVLIGGGYDKKAQYDEWVKEFKDKATWLILMGATAQNIEKTARAYGFENIITVSSMEEAISVSAQKANPGDAVLLSPACASWGMFPNYEVRGNMFKEIVLSMKE